MKKQKYVLPTIIVAQFLCTSIWFASNAVIDAIFETYELGTVNGNSLLTAVQFGFILGTLVFSFFKIPDRYAPSKVFFMAAITGSLANLALILHFNNFYTLLLFRFICGVSLAGIYPVGLKIAADFYKEKLGKSLSYIVAALVLGTSFPFFIQYVTDVINWKILIWTTSSLAVLGGLLILLKVPTGPFYHRPKETTPLASIKIAQKLKQAAYGYFGHMWELYAFWAMVPLVLKKYSLEHQLTLNTNLLSFFIIAIGVISTSSSGFIATKIGTKKTATLFLTISGICCITFPFFVQQSQTIFISYLFLWGMVVIADSPLFSTLVATKSPPQFKGSVLTLVNGIGFLITMISIETISFLFNKVDASLGILCLGVGPILGVLNLVIDKKSSKKFS